MVNWILIGCGIATIIISGFFYYLIIPFISGPLETPDSEKWNNVYVLSMSFGGVALFLIGIFTKK